MKTIYTIPCVNNKKSEIRYTVPIFNFGLTTDQGVTALHIAEHCCFGNYDYSEYFYNASEDIGGNLEASITKKYLSFQLCFDHKHLDKAISIFNEFILGIDKETTSQEFLHYRTEVKEELEDNLPVYLYHDAARSNIFSNVPFCLCSGGKADLIEAVTPNQVNQYRKMIASKGFITICLNKKGISKLTQNNFKLVSIQKLGDIKCPKPSICNNEYIDNHIAAYVLPETTEETALKIKFGLESLTDDIDIEASTFNSCSIIYFSYLNKRHFSRYINKMLKTPIDKIIENAEDTLRLHLKHPNLVSRDFIENKISQLEDAISLTDALTFLQRKLRNFA